MKMIHQLLPYAFYIILIIVIVRAFFKKINNPKKDKLVLITLILAHTQLVLGLIMLIPFLQAGIEMSNSANRFVTVEHPVTMLIGVILITVGKLKAKKIEDIAKANKTIFSYYFIALVVFALRTPWDKIF
jgi:hypothetical protein|tara:strand:+ start:1470 stop:1859 length:390 start_codon:yes stop_codon:yes gene_type:complete